LSYTPFYRNGKPHIVGTYKNGKYAGEWKTFDDQGVLTELSVYNEKGNLDKEFKSWDNDGKLYYTSVFDNGTRKEIKYFDKAGKIVANYKLNDKTTIVKGYFPDGILLYEGAYTKGKPDGNWTYFYKCGKRHIIQNFKLGLLDGSYTSFFASGQKQLDYSYSNDEENGYYKKFYPNGQLKDDGWYVNGKQEGKWNSWNPDGTLDRTVNILHNELDGFMEEYAPDQKIQFLTGYKNGKNISHTEFDTVGNKISNVVLNGENDFSLHYFDGKIRAKSDYKCNQISSKYIFFDRKGLPEVEYEYLNGEKNGRYISYYSPGKVKREGYYETGNQSGVWKYYDEDGHLSRKGYFVNDNKDSLWTAFYGNGKIKSVIWYKNDEIVDTAKYFDSAGEFMYSMVYNKYGLVSYQYFEQNGLVSKNLNPQDSGVIITYYKSGKISSKQAYKYCNLQGEQKLYFSNGNLYKEFFLAENDHLNGKYTEYYENGKIKYVENYLLDLNHGIQQYFRPDGSPEHSEEYKFDNRHGSFIQYDILGKVIKQSRYWGNILIN
jgi:uncharacterized protein